MSANNWRTCPECSRERNAAIEAVKAMYGKVPFDVFNRGMEKAKDIPSKEASLREDWEIYSVDRILHIKYECSCDDCGFSFTYKNEIIMK